MIYYILSIFLSAFLLFQVQPMIARYILPWFGGTPTVWSTVQLFFQVFLTGGYAYSSWLIRRVPARKQGGVHAALLIISLIVVAGTGLAWPSPITPDAGWKPLGVTTPITDIFRLLLVSVGLPYFLLATNSPLMQAWFTRALPGRSPYWLYALSNIGSLLGLLAYPFLIEPNLTLKAQGWTWAAGYTVFGILAAYGAIRSRRLSEQAEVTPTSSQPDNASARPSTPVQVLWVLLSAVASAIYLATTSQITQEVAPIPLLWVVPLAIYLLSFILTYSNERWYDRRLFGGLLVLASLGFAWALADTSAGLVPLIVVYCFLLFVSVMICNGECYRLRPEPAHLTRFYLMTSIGGALGGVAVNLVAPYIFKGYWELPISFGLVWALVLAVFITRNSTHRQLRVRFIANVLFTAAILLGGAFGIFGALGGRTDGALLEERNFYGIVRVKEVYPGDPLWHGYDLAHGITIHGRQFTSAERRSLPTTYFVPQSGVGLALLNHPQRGHGMRVGILGLGIGTLAAYGLPGDTYRFYEINPLVVDLARGQGGYFSFIGDSPAETSIVLGDARISLERELAAGQRQNFDVLVLDVFSGDSIPVHLITKEAFGLYLQDLAPDGILAAHISNRYIDLLPVLWQLSKYYRLNIAVITTQGDGRQASPSDWVLLARDPALLQVPAIAQSATSMESYSTRIPLWTDDFSNLFQLLK